MYRNYLHRTVFYVIMRNKVIPPSMTPNKNTNTVMRIATVGEDALVTTITPAINSAPSPASLTTLSTKTQQEGWYK